VSSNGTDWVLLNASPEIRAQVEAFPALHPRGPRHSPIAAIILTNGDLDHCLGLLSLRESHPLVVYATERVRRGFTEGNILYRTLERFPGQVTWHTLLLGKEDGIISALGEPTGLAVAAVPVPGKPPVHLESASQNDPEENVGLRIRDVESGRVLAYFPGAGGITAEVRQGLSNTDCVFFDGTFWSSDELPALGLGTKRAADMAHLPVGGAAGSLAGLEGLRAPRRILIHLNNTNPLLREDSSERAMAEARGWEVAHDGMEVTL